MQKDSIWLPKTVETETRSSDPLVDEKSKLWSYEGDTGPACWGGLDPSFVMCSIGCAQSPIEIAETVHAHFDPLALFYSADSEVTVYDSGHHLSFLCSPGSHLRFQGQDYALVSAHFHCPGEEVIMGQRHDLVLHLVHQNVSGHPLVLAVSFTCQQRAPVYTSLSTLMRHFSYGEARSIPPGIFDVSSLLPANTRDFYTYMGSLTMPPCQEGVRWLILKEPAPISPQECEEIGKIYMGNVRPIQPLNGRIVYSSCG